MNSIYIAIPTKTGQVYFELLMRLLAWSHGPIKVAIHFEAFQAPIDHCRNIIVKKFLATNCTHLMMIDDDIVPPEETLERMVSHDKSIVAAACPVIGPNENRKLEVKYNAYIDNDGYHNAISQAAQLMEVDATGTGCILIKREVLESMKAPFMTQYNKDTGIKYRGEDISFCKKAKAMQYKIYSDFSLKCKHIKQCNLLEL